MRGHCHLASITALATFGHQAGWTVLSQILVCRRFEVSEPCRWGDYEARA